MNNFKTGRIPLWIAGLAVLVVVAVIALWLIGTKNPLSPEEEQEQKENQEEQSAQKEEVFARIGEITKIENGKIEINAKVIKNNDLQEDTAITILISPETKIYKVTIPQTPPSEMSEGESGPIFKRQEINLSDLKVGQEINGISGSNIRGLKEFTAKKIETTVSE